MKAEEIMIGDWVHWQSNQIDPHQWFNGRVTSIKEYQLLGKSEYDIYTDVSGSDDFSPEELEPIMLTRAVLDRTFDGEDAKIHGRNYHLEDAHGNEYEIHLSYYDRCYFSKLIEDSEFGYKDMELLLDFKYVHELQHILRIFQLPYKLKIEETD